MLSITRVTIGRIAGATLLWSVLSSGFLLILLALSGLVEPSELLKHAIRDGIVVGCPVGILILRMTAYPDLALNLRIRLIPLITAFHFAQLLIALIIFAAI
ncbi:MAG TPA: hypothetical protein VHI13_17840 [Candidatus Kapabacteria bacterium]|nr:hypothetical protein [Candidatus Kapabacteria bacterium]